MFVPGLGNKRNENGMQIPAGPPFILNRTVISGV
jgi:hypothetical protein